ncbi:YncE family protein [Nocardiopsis prasina]|uniref:YncE family protein n=1 Tax=Nocardiopsis prasina TaxID=2015 RepID=UPI00034760F1
MALNNSQKTTLKNSKDNQGVDTESQSQTTSTTTATGTATGTGEVSAQLMLGITGSVSGSLTTGFKTSSTLSGEVGSRVDVLATQRRQVRRFDYEFPITFGGWVALYYPEPVEVKEARPAGPQSSNPRYSRVLAWKLNETGQEKEAFDLTDDGKPFMQRGEAEVVSTLAGEHEVFELENLVFEEKHHPLHKVDLARPEVPKATPDEVATGLGRAEGLALDPDGRKAYVVERGRGGRLHKVDLDSGETEWVAEGLGDTNDVALDPPGGQGLPHRPQQPAPDHGEALRPLRRTRDGRRRSVRLRRRGGPVERPGLRQRPRGRKAGRVRPERRFGGAAAQLAGAEGRRGGAER